jgi:hypothetical protein
MKLYHLTLLFLLISIFTVQRGINGNLILYEKRNNFKNFRIRRGINFSVLIFLARKKLFFEIKDL